MTSIAVFLVAVFLVVQSQTPVSSVFELIIGAAAAVLALLDLFGVRFPIRG